MKKHPTADELIRYLSDPRKQDPAAASTAEHLAAGCEECEALRREFQAVFAALSAPGLAEAPSPVLSRALAWLEQREAEWTTTQEAGSHRARAGSAARRAALDAALEVGRKLGAAAAGAARKLSALQAVLVLDTAAGALLPGIRGATTSAETRRLMYESPAGQIHLQLERARGDRFRVRGQFLPAEGSAATGGRAILSREEHEQSRRLAGTGEFHFDSVPSGAMKLRIEWNDMQIALGPIDLGQGSDG